MYFFIDWLIATMIQSYKNLTMTGFKRTKNAFFIPQNPTSPHS